MPSSSKRSMRFPLLGVECSQAIRLAFMNAKRGGQANIGSESTQASPLNGVGGEASYTSTIESTDRREVIGRERSGGSERSKTPSGHSLLQSVAATVDLSRTTRPPNKRARSSASLALAPLDSEAANLSPAHNRTAKLTPRQPLVGHENRRRRLPHHIGADAAEEALEKA